MPIGRNSNYFHSCLLFLPELQYVSVCVNLHSTAVFILGTDVLCHVVASGRLSLLQRLLAANCRPRNDDMNRTLLMHALQHGQEDIVQYLLDQSSSLCIDVHQKDASGRNALFFRCYYSQAQCHPSFNQLSLHYHC